ncbi:MULTISPECIES: sugar phosphate isomerase/epimerase family protein [Micromonospora]|uniref:Sugar phosphate isomerase/epimerase n=1 Tax=Verrucosispora sioxanthis TaxID=2499994 RepID=A0A6M1L0J4_9ACTN|nr:MULTISPECIES: sugar phosphate isomerase/epimerase family protein [Micromonospora]MCZ7419994.1 sugar phosphate isomerase/epimerase [Verrucosispora sp. WMMA2121]NEE62411.1 sugar phosphate isomerase/epimerase [Verrucosispora sioxanthis]NGM11521.1 sugar phosphate isomerase/epimerase [Verrucosispora sioxanthis]WBB46760.1 sugar phosphate isomerase/epimerase [Verrucosispora sp. WMMA2044]WBB89468.1 sugar phosphate isomerase/epimerase [Verrucosispora sp. WMMC514]
MRAVGVNPWVWASPVDDEALAALIPRIAALGFDAVELPIEQPGDWDPYRVRDLLARYGLAAAGVCAVTPPGRELVNAEPAVVEATVAYLNGCVDSAAIIGAPCVGGPVYASVGRTWRMTPAERATCYVDFRRALVPVADRAGERGVSIGVEALNRYETSVVNTLEQAVEMIDGLPSNVGLMIDTYHMNIEEANPYAALAAAGPHIKHVQVSGTNRGAPGSDHLDWPRLLAALAATGYWGAICIESFTPENATIATAASIWRPLAPSPDRLAGDGLAYLRSILG